MIHIALVRAVAQCNTNPLALHFASMLLNYDVDVNYRQGLPLLVAAENRNVNILTIMIAKRAIPSSLVTAFPHIFAIQPRADEATIIALIKLFQQHTGDELRNSVVCSKITDPPVFMSIYNYPESCKILEAILDAGFPVDGKMNHRLPELGVVSISPLYWALSDHEADEIIVTEPVVHLLLTRNGTV